MKMTVKLILCMAISVKGNKASHLQQVCILSKCEIYIFMGEKHNVKLYLK